MKRRDLDWNEEGFDSSMERSSPSLYTQFRTILSFPGIESEFFKLDRIGIVIVPFIVTEISCIAIIALMDENFELRK